MKQLRRAFKLLLVCTVCVIIAWIFSYQAQGDVDVLSAGSLSDCSLLKVTELERERGELLATLAKVEAAEDIIIEPNTIACEQYSILPLPKEVICTSSSESILLFADKLDVVGNLAEASWQAYRIFFPSLSDSIKSTGTKLTRLVLESDVIVTSAYEYDMSTPKAFAENYELKVDVDAHIVSIKATTSFGIMRGLASLAQIGHACQGELKHSFFIRDAPDVALRSFLVDPPRRLYSTKQLFAVIDRLALLKFNALHLRLSDQEVLLFPQPYSPGILKDIVMYAWDRGVRVIPELDVPGHAGNFSAEVVTTCNDLWSKNLDVTLEETYTYVQELLLAIIPLFPDPLFHLGHDETSKTCWGDSPAVVNRAKALAAAVGFAFNHSSAESTTHGPITRDISFDMSLFEFLMKYWNSKFQNVLHHTSPLFKEKTFVYWGDMVRWFGLDYVQQHFPPEQTVFEPWDSHDVHAPLMDAGYSIIYGNFYWTYIDQIFHHKLYKKSVPSENMAAQWLKIWLRTVQASASHMGYEVQLWEHGYAGCRLKAFPLLTAYSELFWSFANHRPLVADTNDVEKVHAAYTRKLKFDEFAHSFDKLPGRLNSTQLEVELTGQRDAFDKINMILKEIQDSQRHLFDALVQHLQDEKWIFFQKGYMANAVIKKKTAEQIPVGKKQNVQPMKMKKPKQEGAWMS